MSTNEKYTNYIKTRGTQRIPTILLRTIIIDDYDDSPAQCAHGTILPTKSVDTTQIQISIVLNTVIISNRTYYLKPPVPHILITPAAEAHDPRVSDGLI